MVGYTVGERLQSWARVNGDRPAFIFRGTQPGNHRLVLTRTEVFELATACCRQMKELGVCAGHVVCNTLPTSPERLLTDLGTMLAGAATLNGMLHLADGTDLAKCLTRGAVTAMVMDPNQHPHAMDILGERVIAKGENARSRMVPSLQKMLHVDCGGGSELRPWLEQLKQWLDCHLDSVSPDDLAVYFNAAGTTAFSRLVPKTHQEFIMMGEALNDLMGLDLTDVLFNNCSLGWYNGTSCDYVARGSTRVLVDMTVPPEDPLAFAWDMCLAEQCTVCFMLPPAISSSMVRQSLWAGKKHKPRTIVTGGMPVSKQQVTAVGVMCDVMVVSQASAEAGYVTQYRLRLQNTAHYEDGDYGDPVPGYSVRLVSAQGREIPPTEVGRPGEVQVKGPQMSRLCRDLLTPEGWMRTGDVAFYNAQRHLQAVCRNSEAIIHGPYLIYPVWLEKKLEDCPGVRRAVIVPVPDSRMFQEMCVCIVPDRGVILKDAEIRSFCQTLFVDAPLECHQIPKYYLFYAQDFPQDRTGPAPDRVKIFQSALKLLRLSLTEL